MEINTANKRAFLRNWLLYTTLACVLGLGILQPLIAHGFTGEHAEQLTPAQLVMHTLSLVTFATLLVVMQNKALSGIFERKLHAGLLYFLLLIPTMFWLGYYTLYIPFDILFMLLTIGLLNGLSLKGFMKDGRKWIGQSVLSWFCGAVAGIGSGLSAYFLFIKDIKDIGGDFAIWLFIATPAAIVSSLTSKYFLSRQI